MSPVSVAPKLCMRVHGDAAAAHAIIFNAMYGTRLSTMIAILY